MAGIRTEITEIVTGLALLGYRELEHALGVRPRMVSGVTEAHFDRLSEAWDNGVNREEFETAWHNGQCFAYAEDGLRGRAPWWVEWKGPHRPPAYEQVPADLRVDHVYLISCKYGSNILMNASPAHLFDRLLAIRSGDSADWYHEVSPAAHQELWSACRAALSAADLPEKVEALGTDERQVIKAELKGLRGGWPCEEAAEAYRWLAADVSNRSASRWMSNLPRQARQQEEMVWRLLRFAPAPYFVLGSSADKNPLSYRVATPWDFRQRFELKAFDAWGDAVGQPLVRWRADVRDREADDDTSIDGHVEVRWSHGKFGGNPEAKIYLDTPHHAVPGYFPLAGFAEQQNKLTGFAEQQEPKTTEGL